MNDNFKTRLVDKYLTELRNGDDEALSRLYDLVSKPIYALTVSYFKNIADREDAVSETFLTVKKEISKYNGSNGFNWIYTIAKNICLKNLRKLSRCTPVDFQEQSPDEYADVVKYDTIKAYDESGIIAISKKVLSENEFEILIFRAVYGMSYKEIASFQKKLETTVRWQYFNAIRKVREEVERRSGYDE